MPAAVALAERERRSRTDLLRAVALGYDVSARLTMASVLGARRARTLCDAVWKLGRLKDVRTLRPLLQA